MGGSVFRSSLEPPHVAPRLLGPQALLEFADARARTRQSLGVASGDRAARGWAAEVRGAESEPPPPPLLLLPPPPPPPERSMSATRAKKVKMATKSCPECDQQVGAGSRALNTRASGAGALGQAAVVRDRWLWRGRLAGVPAAERVGQPSGSVATAGARTGPAEPRGCRGSARSRGPAGVRLAAVRQANVLPCGWAA